jgi:hypothetical protein
MKTKLFLKTSLLLIFILFFSTQSYSGPRRVLLEFSTGTWCGYCPCGDSIILHHILNQFPQTVVLAYHGSGSDPFINFNGNNIISLLGINAYPLAVFDRQSGPPMDYDYNWPETCAVRYQRKPNSDVSISFVSKDYNTSTRVLTATVDLTALQNLTGQYKVNYVITENNIVYQQNFYASCGAIGYIQNYVHYWVTRNMINGATGENVNSGNWNQNQTITKTINTTLDAGWVASNCNLIIFVYKDTPPLIQSTVEQSTIQSVTNPLGVNGTLEIPKEYRLEQNYPNPFNPVTNIKYSVPKDGNVSLKVYDAIGNEVSTIVNGVIKAGVYNAEFDGSNFASGVYFYTIKTNEFTSTKKMVLVK